MWTAVMVTNVRTLQSQPDAVCPESWNSEGKCLWKLKSKENNVAPCLHSTQRAMSWRHTQNKIKSNKKKVVTQLISPRIAFSKVLNDWHQLIHLHPLCRASPQRLWRCRRERRRMRRAPRQGQFCHHGCAGGGGRQRASQEGRIHTVWILSGEP